MKSSLLPLIFVTGLAHATPPVLSFTQAALQKVDPDIKPDHYDIARTIPTPTARKTCSR